MHNIVIISGDPISGVDVIGPFENFDIAIEYASDKLNDIPWWTTEVKDPNKKYTFDPVPF